MPVTSEEEISEEEEVVEVAGIPSTLTNVS